MSVDEFAARLRLLRLHRRIAQGALAKRIGVPQQTLCLWEGGTRKPRADNLAAWAAALDETPPTEVLKACLQPSQCGSNSGYQKHVRDRTPPCAACLAAHGEYQKTWRGRQQVAS